ncbi:MAG: hypothetical protein JXM79_11970 [Sedimentisphaerales bacterium]|nr:hypothetical protein [Sedimentisphaerales bacterium]
MTKQTMFVTVICMFPLNLLANASQGLINEGNPSSKGPLSVQRKVTPLSKNTSIRPGYHLDLSEFRISQSQGKYYWHLTLENRSSRDIPARSLEIQGYQLAPQNKRDNAGDPIVNSIEVPANRSIQLQREFVPLENVAHIGIEVVDRAKRTRLASKTFDANLSGLKLVTKFKELTPVFMGRLRATIKADLDNYLWYVEIMNTGNGTLSFSDYDFNILPSIRGVQEQREPFTDVSVLYETTLKPGEVFKIYIATGYDSCFAGNLISVKITDLKSNKIVNLFQPVNTPLYPSGSWLNGGTLRYYDLFVDVPVLVDDLPPYFKKGVLFGELVVRYGKLSVDYVNVNHVEAGANITLPNSLTFKNNFKSVYAELKMYADFGGRLVLIKSGAANYEGDHLIDMEHPSTITVR